MINSVEELLVEIHIEKPVTEVIPVGPSQVSSL